jgi:hypothetical protein
MEKTYSIINISTDPQEVVSGLSGLTLAEANEWMIRLDDIINLEIREDILP